MARILLTYFAELGEAMYDAVTDFLIENGNDVFRFNTNNHSYMKWNNWGGNIQMKNRVAVDEIAAFNPEIALDFNNSTPTEILDALPEKCKICILDADNPEMFWNREALENRKDSYYYLGMQKFSKAMYENLLKVKIREGENYLFFPFASVVKAENLPKDKNISFIGSNFYHQGNPEDMPSGFYDKIGLELYRNIKKDYFYPKSEALNLIGSKSSNPMWLYEATRAYYAGQERLKSLSAVASLGLVLYGTKAWAKSAYYDFEIADSFDSTPIATLEENQWVYNTSKISVNISHPQAITAFSWRVMDIMASSSCLLVEDKPDWHDLFGKYISDEVKSAVIYTDRFDMRAKAKALLADEKLRLRCVKELNAAIEKNGRWEHRFTLLEKFLGIKLLGIKGGGKLVKFIQRQGPLAPNKYAALIANLKLKKRIKNLVYSFMLFIGQIPLLDLAINKKKREKLIKKLEKYKR